MPGRVYFQEYYDGQGNKTSAEIVRLDDSRARLRFKIYEIGIFDQTCEVALKGKTRCYLRHPGWNLRVADVDLPDILVQVTEVVPNRADNSVKQEFTMW